MKFPSRYKCCSGYSMVVVMVFVTFLLVSVGGLVLSRRMWAQNAQKTFGRSLMQSLGAADSNTALIGIRQGIALGEVSSSDFIVNSDGIPSVPSESGLFLSFFGSSPSSGESPESGGSASVEVSDVSGNLVSPFVTKFDFIPRDDGSGSNVFTDNLNAPWFFNETNLRDVSLADTSLVSLTLSATDPFRGIPCYWKSFGLILQTQLDGTGRTIWQGRMDESTSKLKSSMDIDMARYMEIMIRTLPLSSFTYFQSRDFGGSSILRLSDFSGGVSGWMIRSGIGYGRYYLDGLLSADATALPLSSLPFIFTHPIYSSEKPLSTGWPTTSVTYSDGTVSFTLPGNVLGDRLLTDPLTTISLGLAGSFQGRPTTLLRPGGYPILKGSVSGSDDWWNRQTGVIPTTLLSKLFWSVDVYVHRFSPQEVRVARRGSGSTNVDVPDRFTQAFQVDDAKREIIIDGALLRNFPVRAGQGRAARTFFIDSGQPALTSGGTPSPYPSYANVATVADPVTGLLSLVRSGQISALGLASYRVRLRNLSSLYGDSKITIVSANPIIIEGSFFPGNGSGVMLVAPRIGISLADNVAVATSVSAGALCVVSGVDNATSPQPSFFRVPNNLGVFPTTFNLTGAIALWDFDVAGYGGDSAVLTIPVASTVSKLGLTPSPQLLSGSQASIPLLCPALTDVRPLTEDFLSFKMKGVTP